MFDLRCLTLTIQRNTACTRLAKIQHFAGCECPKPAPYVQYVAPVPHCPCGLPSHKGMCADAARAAAGLAPIVWKA